MGESKNIIKLRMMMVGMSANLFKVWKLCVSSDSYLI